MTKRTIAVALSLTLGAIGLCARARSQSAISAGKSAVSRADRTAIEQLLAAYNQALSTCAGTQYADLFTPDGTFTSDDFRGAKHREMYGKSATLAGRDKLVELVETEEFCRNPEERAARAVRRPDGAGAFSNLHLEPAGDSVHGSLSLGNGGRYEDVYVKTADGWRFRSRNVLMPAN